MVSPGLVAGMDEDSAVLGLTISVSEHMSIHCLQVSPPGATSTHRRILNYTGKNSTPFHVPSLFNFYVWSFKNSKFLCVYIYLKIIADYFYTEILGPTFKTAISMWITKWFTLWLSGHVHWISLAKARRGWSAKRTDSCLGFMWWTAALTMSTECLIMAAECVLSRIKGSSALMAAGGSLFAGYQHGRQTTIPSLSCLFLAPPGLPSLPSATHTLHLLFLLPSGNQGVSQGHSLEGLWIALSLEQLWWHNAYGGMINLVDGVDWFMTSTPWSELECVGCCIKEMLVPGNESFAVPELGLCPILSTAALMKRPLCIYGGHTTSSSSKCWQCQMTLAGGNHTPHTSPDWRVSISPLLHVTAWTFNAMYSGSGVSGSWLWCTVPDDFAAHVYLTLL